MVGAGTRCQSGDAFDRSKLEDCSEQRFHVSLAALRLIQKKEPDLLPRFSLKWHNLKSQPIRSIPVLCAQAHISLGLQKLNKLWHEFLR